jgi:hypothetical protein
MGTYGNIRVQRHDASSGNRARCLKYQLSKKGKYIIPDTHLRSPPSNSQRMDASSMGTYGMSMPYLPQNQESDDFSNMSIAGGRQASTLFAFTPAQKRARTDSNPENGNINAIGLRASGINLVTNDGMHAMDLSAVLSQILERCEQLEKLNKDLKSDLDMAKITYDMQLQLLEETVGELKDDTKALSSGKKIKPPPARQDTAVTVSILS